MSYALGSLSALSRGSKATAEIALIRCLTVLYVSLILASTLKLPVVIEDYCLRVSMFPNQYYVNTEVLNLEQ